MEAREVHFGERPIRFGDALQGFRIDIPRVRSLPTVR